MRVELRRVLIIAALALMGCEEFSYGPEISRLESGVDFPPGGFVLLAVAFVVADPDGDVTGARMFVEDPDGSFQIYDDCHIPEPEEELLCPILLGSDLDATDLDGVTTGTIYAGVLRNAMAGDYTVEVWAIDSEGFESNRLETTITLVESEPVE